MPPPAECGGEAITPADRPLANYEHCDRKIGAVFIGFAACKFFYKRQILRVKPGLIQVGKR
jgi:hypothetical protein